MSERMISCTYIAIYLPIKMKMNYERFPRPLHNHSFPHYPLHSCFPNSISNGSGCTLRKSTRGSPRAPDFKLNALQATVHSGAQSLACESEMNVQSKIQ